MRIGIFVAFAVVSIACSSPCLSKQTNAPPSFHPAPEQIVRENIGAGYSHLQDNDLPAAAAAFDLAIGAAAFAQLPEQERYATLDIATRIASDRHELRRQLDFSTRATASPLAKGSIWFLRLVAAYALEDYQNSALCVETIARDWPQMLDQIKDEAMVKIGRELGNHGSSSMQVAYFDSLFAANWKVDGAQPSLSWLTLSRLLLERGDVAKAALVAAKIDAPRVAIQLQIDKRFERLGKQTTTLDIAQLSAAAIARDELLVEREPKRLTPILALQDDLMESMQYARVLSISDGIIEKTRGGDGSDLYEDFDKLIWVMDYRSRALQCLGRWDDAVKQATMAARRPEGGRMNVSQAINKGALLMDLGRANEALDAVSELGPLSGYGRMQLESVRLAVGVQTHAEADVAAHLEYMKSHRDEAISTYNEALLEAGRSDAAADVFIERLQSEKWRGDALVQIQKYRDVPQTPVMQKRMGRWRELLGRPEVQAEVAKVGFIREFDLSPPKA